MPQVSQLEGSLEKKKHLKEEVWKRNTHPHPKNNIKEVLEVVQVVLLVEDLQVKDLQVEDMVVVIGDDDDDDDDEEKGDENSEVKEEEKYEDEYIKLKITPGQFPVKIGEKIFYVQPAIVEHDLFAPGSRASPPPPQIYKCWRSRRRPPPLAHQVLSLDLEVQKVRRVTKGIKVTREIEVQEERKVIREILVYKELLVYKLELEVLQ